MSSLLPTLAAVAPVASGWTAHTVFLRQRLAAAQRDPLSGLLRREAFQRAAARILRKRPAAVVVVDLDGFKAVNDTYGHAAGDAIIRTTGAALNEALDGRGAAGRLGGDEFAAVVALPDPIALPWLLGGLHDYLSAPTVHEGQALVVGASVGGVCAPAGADLSVALRRADEVMYGVKQTGGGWLIAKDLRPAYRTVNGRRDGRPGTDLDGGAG